MDKLCNAFVIICLSAYSMNSCTADTQSKVLNPSSVQLHDKMLAEMNRLDDSLKLKNSYYTTVNISELIGLDWDSLYFFKEDSDSPTDEAVSKIIGVNFHGSGFMHNSSRLIFLKNKQIVAVVDFNREENDNISLAGGWDNSKEPNDYQKFLKSQGDKFIYFVNCKYEHKYHGLVKQKYFDAKTFLGKNLYNPCY